MRIILFLLFTFWLTQPVLSQHPTKAQMDEEMQQSLKDIRKQITDQEKDIATAKANHEDVETIQEMEKQLAMMKKMLGMLDKTSSLVNTRPQIPADNTIPLAKYQSPIVPIPLRQPVVAPTEVQAKNRLLWYHGKKLNDSMLVTTKKMVVLYSKKRNMVIVKPDEKKDSTFVNIVANLSKSRQWTNNYFNKLATTKNSFFDYPQALMTLKEFGHLEDAFNKIAQNTISLPAPGSAWGTVITNTSPSQSGPYPEFEMTPEEKPAGLEDMYRALMDLMNHPPSMDFPPPPEEEFSLCYYCDPAKQSAYDKEVDDWGEAFFDYESKLISGGIGIFRAIALLGFGGPDADQVNYPSIPTLEQDVNKAMKLGWDRMEEKINKLTELYGHDVHRQTAVIQKVLGFDRQKQLMGLTDDNSTVNAGELVDDMAKDFTNYMNQEINAKNYDVVFNYTLLLSLQRQVHLLGGTDATSKMLDELSERVVNFNRFELTVDMDFALQFVDTEDKPFIKATGSLSLSDNVYVSLGRMGCKWQLYLTNADYRNGDENDFRLPIKVNSGTKLVKQGDSWITYPYSGPTDMLMVFPSFRISFCQGGGSDSAMTDVLRYKIDDLSPYANSMDKDYTIDLLQYANKMFVSIDKGENNMDQNIDLMGEMMSTGANAHIEAPTGNTLLDQLQVEYLVNLQQHEMQKRLTESSKVPKTVILFDAVNNSAVLVDSNTDTANKEKNIDLTKGQIRLKVVHAPR
jgi:hypothetical protein